MSRMPPGRTTSSLVRSVPASSARASSTDPDDPDAFEACFARWAQSWMGQVEREVVAIDGKTLLPLREQLKAAAAADKPILPAKWFGEVTVWDAETVIRAITALHISEDVAPAVNSWLRCAHRVVCEPPGRRTLCLLCPHEFSLSARPACVAVMAPFKREPGDTGYSGVVCQACSDREGDNLPAAVLAFFNKEAGGGLQALPQAGHA